MTNAEVIIPNETEPAITGRIDFLDILGDYPEIQPLPESLLVQEDDSYESYVQRADSVGSGIRPGVYMTDPDIGRLYIPDTSEPPKTSKKIIPDAAIDTRAVASNNGFFAHAFQTPEGSSYSFAFRPFDPDINPSVVDDFARNNIIRHLGIENTQTIGFYINDRGMGGTISILDRSIRSADTLSTELLMKDGEESILSQAARELAFIHTLGVTHGDVFLRNMVQDDTGRVFFIDWGKSGLKRPSNSEAAVVTRTSEHDVLSLRIDILDLRPSLDGRKEHKPEYRKNYERLFVQPYFEWRRHFNESLTHKNGRQTSADLELELANILNLVQKV